MSKKSYKLYQLRIPLNLEEDTFADLQIIIPNNKDSAYIAAAFIDATNILEAKYASDGENDYWITLPLLQDPIVIVSNKIDNNTQVRYLGKDYPLTDPGEIGFFPWVSEHY